METTDPPDPPDSPEPPETPVSPESAPIPEAPESPAPKPETPPPPSGPKLAVYVDVDGTLADVDLIGPLRWLKYRELGFALYAFWSFGLFFKLPYWSIVERRNRERAQASIYFEYGGMNVDETIEAADGCYRGYIRPRVYAAGLSKLKQLHALDYKVVLVTEGLDFLFEALARDVKGHLISPKLAQSRRVFTGALDTGALVGERKANAVQAHAEENNIDLKNSFAFANSLDDLSLLEAVGKPIAVNPTRQLERIATERNWPIENWKTR